jgi:hypothetical protein
MTRTISHIELYNSRLPRFWGIAWRKPNQMAYVLLPIPFNVVARYVRDAWFAVLQFFYFKATWGKYEQLPFEWRESERQKILELVSKQKEAEIERLRQDVEYYKKSHDIVVSVRKEIQAAKADLTKLEQQRMDGG